MTVIDYAMVTAVEPVHYVDQQANEVNAAVRHLEILAEAVTEECCQQVEIALIMCRGETSRRADAEEFFAAARAHVGELRALLLRAASEQFGECSVLAQ
ncbi:hypothetical protein [Mycobacteroides abscessus]|uniref:hypothetical protein n=1 Tax=Mycobacteroides abscessus TaxID=36809 RepID=UPI00092A14EF|nr:hypothetical protein [Mycobacteroides abscessus]MDO3068994.1 hypothetical protein [Mycobacteroides abscessus subsp. bolletii]SHQ88118.1 Uncharacterised protein [Mycobacteroides abscessus subsp. bolletii]SHR74904.1 Uncharacterised protein [Mycobacteroides abscessus subsp. bolletii]SHT18228.1 Uncharacterised protein [Mycobacteroides abscessus subsp. bolletii]SKG03887.1 Uncharacterised protein [Mycobacteroides abscessus subsp. bolletii]